mmetsp:Transcript_131819/g.229180  ORF Transcript_131819/g.229180 Transcript_131819/m.229180 type:complete len:269 (+) Transcript_131819:81-887(+)
MQAHLLLLAFFACSGAQANHREQSDEPSQTSLAKLILARSPAAAFVPCGARSPTHTTFGPALSKWPRDLGRRIPKMSDEAEVVAVDDTVDASAAAPQPTFDVKELAGVTAPLGFFDPVGFSADASEGRIRFYREVELKHGRLGMLAALGFLVGEQWHPLFGGDIDVPSYLAFQQTPLEKFWGLVVAAISVNEVYSLFTFNNPVGGEPWSIRSDHEPGNLLFDPLKLRPEDPKAWRVMQDKELNNGRLAMLAAAGMIAQELVTGKKLFG